MTMNSWDEVWDGMRDVNECGMKPVTLHLWTPLPTVLECHPQLDSWQSWLLGSLGSLGSLAVLAVLAPCLLKHNK